MVSKAIKFTASVKNIMSLPLLLAIVVLTSVIACFIMFIVFMFWMRRRMFYHKKNASIEEKHCSQCTGGDAKWAHLMDPNHNVKEIVRNCSLLEIHLAKERCIDCITKHTMIISGLIDEGICLGNDPKYRKLPCVKTLKSCVPEMKSIEQGLFTSKDTPIETAYKLRKMRKKLMPHINATMDRAKFDNTPEFDPHVCSCKTSQLPLTKQIANTDIDSWIKVAATDMNQLPITKPIQRHSTVHTWSGNDNGGIADVIKTSKPNNNFFQQL